MNVVGITPLIKVSCEDNMELMARYPNKYFDLAIVDPPYFDGPNKLGYYGNPWSSIGVKRDKYDKIGTWDVPGEEYFKELFRVSKNQIVWGCNYYAQHIPGPGRIVWDKVNGAATFSDAEIAYCSMHDTVRMIAYMWNGMMQGKSITEGRIMQGNKKLNERRIHPTQKPINLYRWLLQKYAKPGDKILDTHFGSGSIAIPCHDYRYDLTACEIDPKIFELAMERVSEYTDQLQLF